MFRTIGFAICLTSIVGCSSVNTITNDNSAKARQFASEEKTLETGEVLYLQDCSTISCSSKINPRPVFPGERVRALLEGDSLVLPDGSQIKCVTQGPKTPPPAFPPEHCR